MLIEETCRCGAKFKVENYDELKCQFRHIDFLSAHKVCREASPPNDSTIKGKDYKKLYYELIMAVEAKYANETRHETALRYIQEREALEPGPCGAEV